MKYVCLLWMIAGSFSLLAGCSPGLEASPDSVQALTRTPSSPVIALDVSKQGLLKVAGLPDASSLQALSVPAERKVVLLGETFVQRHGIITTKWDLPAQTLGSLGEKPLVALVAGEASAWMQQQPAEPWLKEVVRLGEQLTAIQQEQEGRMKDRLLPFIDGAPASPGTGVRVRAAAMSGRAYGVFLTERELQLLACLNGQEAELTAGSGTEAVRCRVEWRSNGELQAPKLVAQVDVSRKSLQASGVRKPEPAAEIAADQLQRELLGLIRQLQSHRTDPLDIGLSVRSQYRGVWTPERWHDAFARAEVQMKVRVL